jgi:hypothetical protein
LHGLDRVLDTYRKLRYSLRPRFELEVLLQELAFLRDHVHPRDLVAQLRELKQQVLAGVGESRAPAAPDAAATAAQSATPSGADAEPGGAATEPTARALDAESVGAVSSILEERKPTLAAALKKAEEWVEEPAGTIRISFGDSFAARTVRQEAKTVAEAAEQALGRSVSVSVADRADGVDTQDSPQQGNTEDETVQMVRDVFRGQIVEE